MLTTILSDRCGNFHPPSESTGDKERLMDRQRTRLSLHIEHPTRDLASVCETLGLQPNHIWKKGDERRTPIGTKIGGTRASSYLSIELDASSREPMQKRIEAALALLKPHRTLLRRLSSTGGMIRFYVGWFCVEDTGERLSWQILAAMADLRIGLDLNVYVENAPTDNALATAR